MELINIMFDMIELEKAIDLAGGAQKVADELDLHPMAVRQWTKRGIPAKHVYKVAKLSGFQVSCHQLRPDVFPESMSDIS